MSKKLLICIFLTVSSLFALDKQQDSPMIPGGTTPSSSSRLPPHKNIEQLYTMTASVRPLLFWISRDDVGGGRISLTQEPNAERIQLLIGSDPDRAPWQINRWGYISEHISSSSAELIGIMTQSDEESIEQAGDNARAPGDRHPFKAIRSQLNERKALSSTYLMNLNENFTYKNVDTVLELVPKTDSSVREMEVPPGADPGFLYSVKEMIHESVEKYRQSGHVDKKLSGRRRYVYNASLFELSLKSSKLLKKADINGCSYQKLIESRFEARNIKTGKTTKFTVSYGIDGPFSEVPVRIVYQPRWWFRAELMLIADQNEKDSLAGIR